MIVRLAIAVYIFALPLLAQQPSAVSSVKRPNAELEIPRAVPVRTAPPALIAPEKVPLIGGPASSAATIKPTPASAVPALAPPSAPAVPPPVPTAPNAFDVEPSWETQKLARTYVFSIPAPRGMITDRTGVPLAQTRVAQNLVIQFPTPPQFNDAEASRYIFEQVARARGIIRRDITVDADKALKHYKNRGIMPLVIAQNLKPAEVEAVKQANAPGISLQQIYQRYYPQGATAGHIVGYVGRQGTYSTGVVENSELLWPGSEGREGLEKTFNEQLTGKNGVMAVSFDAQGRKSSEKVVEPPTPGQNVVTALDLNIQRIVERALADTKRPSAMVVMNPNSGEILAMASMPSYNPNDFIPNISVEAFDKLNNDPAHPLIPRAFRASYPPGSTFKIITGLAAMNEGLVDPDDEFGGEAVIEIGGIKFRNWKKSDVGPLNFAEALTQSCNTYFYKMGLKTGYKPIIEYAQRLGLGAKTGIPIGSEDDGNLMTSEYMMKLYKRRIMPGDIANMSIGQGDTLVTPLQLTGAVATVANGGTVYQPRLVLQLQGPDGKVTFGYEVRVRDQIEIDKATLKSLREGLLGVVNSGNGTAHQAQAPGFKVAGKTGTAQWGAGKNEKVAAWFTGYAPADKPQFAFTSLYEGTAGNDDVHGGTNAAPIVGRVLKQILKKEPKEKKGGLRKKKPVDEDEEVEDDPPPRARPVKRPTEEVVQ